MMANVAIHIDGLSKRYRIGERQPYKALRDTISNAAAAPFRAIRSGSLRTGGPRRKGAETMWALKDLGIEIEQGEVVGIIGRNGAGKTTLLKLLARITQPTEGYAEVRGRVGSLLEVGTGFHPELTGRENVSLNGAILGMKRREIKRKFDDIVEFAGVETYIDTPMKRYSTGMQMRLAFAVAAHLEPEILLVDEVLAVGDAEFQRKCLGKMQEVAKGGRTVLFVSHNMTAITRLCPRVVLLEGGQLVLDGSPEKVTSYYLNEADEKAGTREWSLDSAPGTQELRITSVTLLSQAGEPTSYVNISEPVDLRIGYYVGHPGLPFRVTVEFNTQGVIAFYCVEPAETVSTNVGQHYSTLAIPGDLLTEGEYSIRVSIFSSRGFKRRYASVKDAMVFQVYDPMTGTSARGDFAQNHPGVLRPMLEWRQSTGEAEDKGEIVEDRVLDS